VVVFLALLSRRLWRRLPAIDLRSLRFFSARYLDSCFISSRDQGFAIIPCHGGFGTHKDFCSLEMVWPYKRSGSFGDSVKFYRLLRLGCRLNVSASKKVPNGSGRLEEELVTPVGFELMPLGSEGVSCACQYI
jgi:hypothetical protein